MKKIRKHILFEGIVQGVGFRYKACHIAREYGMTGWVENLWDGSVQMEVQGTEAEIDRMIYLLSQDRYIVIDSWKGREIPVRDDERSFGVKGY